MLDKGVEIPSNSNLQDTLNMSSIDVIQIILGIESEFAIEFDEEYLTIENLSCVHSMSVVVKKLMDNNPQPNE
jgi:acyl carrier protein